MLQLLIYLGLPFTLLIQGAVILVLLIIKLFARLNLPQLKFTPPKLPNLPGIKLPATSLNMPNTVFFVIGVVLGAVLTSATIKWFSILPNPKILQNPPSLTTKILDRNGNLLYQIYRDENRTLVKLKDLPQHLIDATLSAEDKNFYNHHGLDYLGIIRAFGKNLKNCRFFTVSCSPEGGSTLTQQLIKNTLLSPHKTIDRKLKEAVLALWVERLYDKNTILELYLNEVSYGGTAYGIQAGAEYYFGKDAHDLTLAESALLAGITISPTTLSPLGSHPYLAKDRQLFILSRMVAEGHISEEEKMSAANTALTLRPKNIALAAPHFVMWLKEKLVAEYGENMVSQGGLTITTTLDLDTQRIMENAITQELARLHNLKVTNGAGIVTNPRTGEVLAMVGSHNYYDYQHDGQVNITTSSRQPGSSIKPITYALALMNGLTPSSTIEDAPICFTQIGSPPYCPKNYDGRFHGTVTLRTALASSYNVPAVKLLNGLGVNNMVKLAQELGITTWQDSSRFGLALTLGGGEVKMTDMAEVYGTFANSGTHVPLRSILKIEDAAGNLLTPPSSPESSREVIPKTVTFQLNNILADNNARASAFGYNSVLNIPSHQVAVKTGTTNSLRDNWTFGYTQDILVGSWVGNNDNTPMSSVASGITGASPIWRHTMDKLLEGSKPHVFVPPAGTKKIAFCKETRGVYCKDICPSPPLYDYFAPGTEPKGSCTQQSGTLLP